MGFLAEALVGCLAAESAVRAVVVVVVLPLLQLLGEQVVKFIEPLGQTGRRKKYHQFTAIDDCTRLRVLRAYPRAA